MYKISLITGDGIGPEISASAVSILNTINDKLGLKFEITKLQAGDQALKETRWRYASFACLPVQYVARPPEMSKHAPVEKLHSSLAR